MKTIEEVIEYVKEEMETNDALIDSTDPDISEDDKQALKNENGALFSLLSFIEDEEDLNGNDGSCQFCGKTIQTDEGKTASFCTECY